MADAYAWCSCVKSGIEHELSTGIACNAGHWPALVDLDDIIAVISVDDGAVVSLVWLVWRLWVWTGFRLMLIFILVWLLLVTRLIRLMSQWFMMVLFFRWSMRLRIRVMGVMLTFGIRVLMMVRFRLDMCIRI